MRMRHCLLVFQILLLLASPAVADDLDRYRGSLPRGTTAATGVDLAAMPDALRPLAGAFLDEVPDYGHWGQLATDAAVERPVTGVLIVEAAETSAVVVELTDMSDEEWVRAEAILRLRGYVQSRRDRVWSKEGTFAVVRLGSNLVAIGSPPLVTALRRPRRSRGALPTAASARPKVAVAWHVQDTPAGVWAGHLVAGDGVLFEVTLPADDEEAATQLAKDWSRRLAGDSLAAELDVSPKALAIIRRGKVKAIGRSVLFVFTATGRDAEEAAAPLVGLLEK